MANDHFISRFLTSPWECEDRQLRFFDFSTQTFGKRSSRRLFARNNLTTPAVETMLNRYVETPAAEFANDLRAGKGLVRFDELDWKTIRSLALLFSLNVQRILEATGEQFLHLTLSDFETGGEPMLDEIARYTLARFKMAVVRIPGTLDLCFPEVAAFPLPFPAHSALGLPLSLHAVLLMAQGDDQVPESSINELIDSELFPILSIGIGGQSHRVILPPGWRALVDTDPHDAQTRLNELRGACRELLRMVSKAAEIAGIVTWRVLDA